MECIKYAESRFNPTLTDHSDNEGESDDDDQGQRISMVKPWVTVNSQEALGLSLCDGAGCAALPLKKVGWEDIELYCIIAVEKLKTQRKICDAANPATDAFPGVEHGLNGKHASTLITEQDVRTMPRDTLKLLLARPDDTGCVEFCKLRLLPDRASYKGPKTYRR